MAASLGQRAVHLRSGQITHPHIQSKSCDFRFGAFIRHHYSVPLSVESYCAWQLSAGRQPRRPRIVSTWVLVLQDGSSLSLAEGIPRMLPVSYLMIDQSPKTLQIWKSESHIHGIQQKLDKLQFTCTDCQKVPTWPCFPVLVLA